MFNLLANVGTIVVPTTPSTTSSTTTMFPARKIKRRGKFKAPPSEEAHCSQSIGGADPTNSYLDVIPEARALYQGLRPKRKSEEPTKDTTSTPVSNDNSGWKRYRETRLISLQNLPEDGQDSTSSDEDEDEEETDQLTETLVAQSLIRQPRKRKRPPTYHETIEAIDDMLKDFRLVDDTYKHIMMILKDEMLRGLCQDTHRLSTVRMYPTYVRSTPDGSETGRFLALDLGGTNFRVLLVDLRGKDAPETKSKVYLIPKRIMIGSGQMLFDHIANCIAEFLEKEGLKNVELPMGFTFSFPCYQEGLAAARLVRWTKGFKCAGVEGEDVVKLLHEAIQRRNDIKVRCIAIINDPVGALMAEAHSDKNCCVGVILGTGTNCCYMENLNRVELWDDDRDDPKQVIVNTEWGAFGDNGRLSFLRNAFDKELDKNSLNPGHQLFEKMISGMYMGEIVRLILCQLTADGLIFGGEGSEELFTPSRFLTKYISEIERDDPAGGYSNTKICLQELDIPHFTLDDCRSVQHVCWQVSQRAAFLAATAIATVITHLNRENITVAIDGSLYRFHPHFPDLMTKKIAQLIEPHQNFKLVVAHDGSGKGAALVAAVALRQPDNHRNRPASNNINNKLKAKKTQQQNQNACNTNNYRV